ncbi:XTP/dITP diphosphatase [Natronospora cellulosivora (SeqCode)]
MKRKLLVASGNQGKVREIKKYLEDLGKNLKFEVISMNSFPQLDEVIEDGDSFRENALKKARTRAEETGLICLADDSGLLVECLNGAPGVYSARYAGEGASDADNNKKLIKELEGFSYKNRKAYFKCVMALIDLDEDIEIVVEGNCPGFIHLEPRGENGFGYDPLFFLEEYDKTMAELSLDEKNKISHRARALDKMKKEVIERYS